MKFTCDHCGEIVESGLENILKHQFEECKAIYTKPIKAETANGFSFSMKVMPYLSLTPIEKTEPNGTENIQHKP
jgi:hypothetical protein